MWNYNIKLQKSKWVVMRLITQSISRRVHFYLHMWRFQPLSIHFFRYILQQTLYYFSTLFKYSFFILFLFNFPFSFSHIFTFSFLSLRCLLLLHLANEISLSLSLISRDSTITTVNTTPQTTSPNHTPTNNLKPRQNPNLQNQSLIKPIFQIHTHLR